MEKPKKNFHCQRGENFVFEPRDGEPTQIWRSSTDKDDFPEILQEQFRYDLEHLHPAYELVQGSVRHRDPEWHPNGFWESYAEATFRRRNGGRERRPEPMPAIAQGNQLPSFTTVDLSPSRN